MSGNTRSWTQADRTLGPLGTPGCTPFSDHGLLSSSPSLLPTSPSADGAGTLRTAPQAASSTLPAIVQSWSCSHFLGDRQFSAPRRSANAKRDCYSSADYGGVSAAQLGMKDSRAARFITRIHCSRWRGGGRAPPNCLLRPCPQTPLLNRKPLSGPSPHQPQVRCESPPRAAAEDPGPGQGLGGTLLPPANARSLFFVLATLRHPG